MCLYREGGLRMGLAIETKCIHGEEHRMKDALCSISYPIYQTASFSHLTPGHNVSGFDYSRESNPTRSYLEETISSLEGAKDTIAFASGMAAIATVFEYFKPGDHVICDEDLYGGVVRLTEIVSKKNGVDVELVDFRDITAIEKAMKDNTKAIYFETPSNPMMHVTDIRRVVKLAHEHHVKVIVDNTFMTPYLQNPLKLGADIVVHSGTKYIGGHNDTVSGFLCVADEELAQTYRLLSKTTGAILAPFECWLIQRGLKTLPIRMERHQENALKIAKWLKEQKVVKEVYYIGLLDHPQYELNRSQARGFSGMISFTVDSKEKAIHILENIKLITFAESLGGTETLLTYPAIQTHSDVPVKQKEKLGITDCLLRLSVGLENTDDLIADLEQAFA